MGQRGQCPPGCALGPYPMSGLCPQMASLSDDALLRVLGYLSTEELLLVRRVCRQWRDVALHADLWRRRDADDGVARSGVLRAVLGLAPCLDTLSVSSNGALKHCGLLAGTTSCATKTLRVKLCGPHNNVTVAAFAIRRQAELGRLIDLGVTFTADALQSDGVGDLFGLLVTTEGLERLKVVSMDSPLPVICHSLVPGCLTKPSLKSLFYWTTTSDHDPFVEFLITSHAATLKSISTTLFGLPASLLVSVQHLIHLACPLLDNMPQLLLCPNLRSLSLLGRRNEEEEEEALKGAEDFFRLATRLEIVRLDNGARYGSLDVSLVQALAESGQAAAEYLLLGGLSPASNQSCSALDPLSAALPRLPRLSELHLDAVVSNALLQSISATTTPCLTTLEVRAPDRCTHAWVHGPVVQGLLNRTPRLHFIATNPKQCPGQCEWCEYCSDASHVTIMEGTPSQLAFISHDRSGCCELNGRVMKV